MDDETKYAFNKIYSSKTTLPSNLIYFRKLLTWIINTNLFSIKTAQIKQKGPPSLSSTTYLFYLLTTLILQKSEQNSSDIFFYLITQISWMWYWKNNYTLRFPLLLNLRCYMHLSPVLWTQQRCNILHYTYTYIFILFKKKCWPPLFFTAKYLSHLIK